MNFRSAVGAAVFVGRMLADGAPIRHSAEWIRSLDPGYLLKQPAPWMPFVVADHLERVLRPGSRIFEFGSGGSTLFWLRWAGHLISVEHDERWYTKVKPLTEGKIVDYRFVRPVPRSDRDGISDPADPASFASDDADLSGMSFREYVCQIDPVEDRSLDVVSVDGRSRPACIVHAAPKVKRGGMLILDNAEREYYLRRTRQALQHFSCETFEGYIPGVRWKSKTNIYTRVR